MAGRAVREVSWESMQKRVDEFYFQPSDEHWEALRGDNMPYSTRRCMARRSFSEYSVAAAKMLTTPEAEGLLTQ
jgi:hypothetical protein